MHPCVPWVGHTSPVITARLDTGRKHLISAGEDGDLLQWDLPYDIPEVNQPSGDRLTSVAVDREENFLMVAGRRGVQVRQLPDFAEAGTFTGHQGRIKALDVASDRSYVVSADRDGAVLIWNIADQQLIDSVQTGFDVNAVSVAPDASGVLIATTDTVALFWNVDEDGDQRLVKLNGHRSEIKSVHLAPNLKLALTAGFDSLTILWDLEKGAVLDTFQASDFVFGAYFLDNGDAFVSVTRSGNLVVRSSTGKILREQVLPFEVNQLHVSPDGGYYAILSIDGQLYLYDDIGDLIRRYFSESPIRAVDLSSTGTFIYGYNRLGEVIALRNDRPPLEKVLEIILGKH